MIRFVHISSGLWQLTGDMSQLSSPGYERIIHRIAREVDVAGYRRERAKRKAKCFRACVKLKCGAETISLFHNSRSGYRARSTIRQLLAVKRQIDLHWQFWCRA